MPYVKSAHVTPYTPGQSPRTLSYDIPLPQDTETAVDDRSEERVWHYTRLAHAQPVNTIQATPIQQINVFSLAWFRSFLRPAIKTAQVTSIDENF